jgi:glucose-6-phosphate 1-epimerase
MNSPTRLSGANGVELTLAQHGAQVMGWSVAGQEQLYTSPHAVWDGQSALRGGVPICFPQFNARSIDGRALPKHGFARNLPWRWAEQGSDADGAFAALELTDSDLSAPTRALWPLAFRARMQVRASLEHLRVTVEIHNSGAQELPFALALHTYLRVSDVREVSLHGLQGVSFWDAVANLQQPLARSSETKAVYFGTETDRVYANAPRSITLHDDTRRLEISASDTLPDTVVWNPGADLCARLSDMPADGWQHMLCVEAAAIETPVRLAPGAVWRGWQELRLL